MSIVAAILVANSLGATPPSNAPDAGPDLRALLESARREAEDSRKEWYRIASDFPRSPIAYPEFSSRRLSIEALDRALEPLESDEQRLALLQAFNSYQRRIQRLSDQDLRAVRTVAMEIHPALEAHEPEAVERFCGELIDREAAVETRWRDAERAFVLAARPLLGERATSVIEEWEWTWACAAGPAEDLPLAANIDLRRLVAADSALKKDAVFMERCEEILRAHTRRRVELLWTQHAVSLRTRCEYMRNPMDGQGPSRRLRSMSEHFIAAREASARHQWKHFESASTALEKLVAAAGPERGAALRDRFDAAVAPVIDPDPTDLAGFEESLREAVGSPHADDEQLRRLFDETRTQRLELRRRMRDASLKWSFDKERTGASTDWQACCEAILALGRQRMALARAAVLGVKNQFAGTPHEDAVAALCATRDAELAAPPPVRPDPRMPLTLDFASPDDAETQLLEQIERLRADAEARRRDRRSSPDRAP